jgi:signal transduction histidine kinase
LTNVARHASVPEATVQLWADNQRLSIEVQDNGKGFDFESTIKGSETSGLAGMRERAMLLGGQLTVESSARGGTRLVAELRIDDLASNERSISGG